ncbi:MAG: hypothetical protein WC820_09410 [Spirochaetales bacterium]|jgi:hypothetical protein
MKRLSKASAMPARIVLFTLALALTSCAVTKPVVYKLDGIPEAKARTELILPLLTTLRDFGNNMAALMLTDYRFKEIQETGNGAYLYRFDGTNQKLPRYAYLVFRLEGKPAITTNLGEKNYILLDGGSIGLVPTDSPATVASGKFALQFTKSDFREAFNPWVIGEKGSYPEQLLLWFKNPTTKDEDMRRLASLLTSAFPRIRY